MYSNLVMKITSVFVFAVLAFAPVVMGGEDCCPTEESKAEQCEVKDNDIKVQVPAGGVDPVAAFRDTPGSTPAPGSGGGEGMALPEGHPVIGEGAEAGGMSGMTLGEDMALPEGHPVIGEGAGAGGMSGMTPGEDMALPEGHPVIGEGAGAGGMSGMTSGGNMGAMGSDAKGTLIIKVDQGTKDGQQIINETVNVVLTHRGQTVDELEATADEKGMIIFEDVDLTTPVIPMVWIDYQGVRYQANGKAMSGMSPDQMVRLTVYESTEDAVRWDMKMYHVMLQGTPDSLLVNQLMVISNLEDRSWMGGGDKKAEGEEGEDKGHERTGETLVIPLPANAVDVEIDKGFSSCCTEIIDNKVTSYSSLKPGSNLYSVFYKIPATDGKVVLDITLPVDVKQFSVFIPDDGTTVETEDLISGESFPDSKTNMLIRKFTAVGMEKGKKVRMVVSDLPKEGDQVSHVSRTVNSKAPKFVAGIGALAVLIIGGIAMWLKSLKKTPGSHTPKPQEADQK